MSVREKAQRRFCPKCGAEPGHPCVGPSGPRIANHIERRKPKLKAPRKRGDAQGYVYFLKMEVGGETSIKIGFTRRDPRKRVAALQTGSPVPLAIVGLMRASQALERALHSRFAADCAHGEWFRPSDELWSLIATGQV